MAPPVSPVSPPHLLHLFSTFAAGGPQVRTAALIRAAGPAFRHTIVALDGNFACRERLADLREGPDGIIAYADPPKRGWLGGNVLRFARLIDQAKPDAVLTYNWGAIEAVVGARVAGGRSLIHVEDGFGPEEARGLLWRRVAFRRIVLPFARKVVVPSHGLARIAAERWRVPAAKLVHLQNGIDLDYFAPVEPESRARRDELREQWGARAVDCVVGTVARLRAEKGLELLLASFAVLRARTPASGAARVRLVVVGDGPEEERLRAEATRIGVAGEVVFAGACADARDALRAFDLFAMTSHTEQMPISLLEAMGCGLAVVATDVGDVSRMVAEANRPFVRSGRDPTVLSDVIVSLRHDPARRAALGAANRQKALAEYSLPTMVGRWRGLWEEVARS